MTQILPLDHLSVRRSSRARRPRSHRRSSRNCSHSRNRTESPRSSVSGRSLSKSCPTYTGNPEKNKHLGNISRNCIVLIKSKTGILLSHYDDKLHKLSKIIAVLLIDFRYFVSTVCTCASRVFFYLSSFL